VVLAPVARLRRFIIRPGGERIGVIMRSILILLTLAGATLAGQTAPMTGNWVTATHRLDDGTDYKIYFRLKQTGSGITGQVVHPWGIRDISNGKVTGSHFRFEELLWPGELWVNEGEVSGDTLKYKGNTWGGKVVDYVARRVAESEGQSPAAPALPELRALPDNGLAKTPPMGWNSWNKFEDKVTDALVREMADVMVKTGMRDAGYVYINIDDTWEGQRDANGVLQANHKFPDMKALADYVHSKGLKLGIYSSPGTHTCAGYAGSFGHEEQDAKTWAQWGVDYIKYDWCSAGKVYKLKDRQKVYQVMGEALQKASRPIVYSVCQYGADEVWKWGPAVGGNLWRTTGDIKDNWKSMSEIGFKQGDLSGYARPGHWNDPDMLEVGNGGMTGDEYRTHMTLWAMVAAPLLAGNDLRTMSEETRSILMNRDVIAIDQDRLGKPGAVLRKAGDVEVWTRPLAGGAVAVAVFNRGEAAVQASVKLAELGQGLKGKTRDVWAGRPVKFAKGEFSATAPRHGVVLLRVE